jgi:hypothetical protein
MARNLRQSAAIVVLFIVACASSFAGGWVVGYRQGVYDGWKVTVPDLDDATPPPIAAP